MFDPFRNANTVDLYVGNCLSVLPTLSADTFNACTTSPPYYGLRDYGTGAWEGGDPMCDHKIHTNHQKQGNTSLRAGRSNIDAQKNENFHHQCPICGAIRIDQQIGHEVSPDDYVEQLVNVFNEVRRVLRPDGTIWLNLGDSYANDDKWGGSSGGKHAAGLHGDTGIGRGKRYTGAKAKDLLGIPWRVAFALQADGWWLRSAIVWHKGNAMPESVKDRPTSAYEMVFLLAKSERYFYDADAVREPHGSAYSQDAIEKAGFIGGDRPVGNNFSKEARYRTGDTTPKTRAERAGLLNPLGRNARNVWSINTKPYRDAHFATMAPELAKRCILAGCPEGGTVLDPFGGAGTTGLVAAGLGRRATLIELNPEYAEITRKRLGHLVADASLPPRKKEINNQSCP